jgi:hypothetical protein
LGFSHSGCSWRNSTEHAIYLLHAQLSDVVKQFYLKYRQNSGYHRVGDVTRHPEARLLTEGYTAVVAAGRDRVDQTNLANLLTASFLSY